MSAPTFNALLFGLTGCLVDHGARTLALAQLHSGFAEHPADLHHPDFLPALLASADECAEALPAVLHLLRELQQQGMPCAWLDELPDSVALRLAAALPTGLHGSHLNGARPWPAPDAIWQTLSELEVESLQGCVLIASDPRLLQAGLNAGLWCIGLATCGALCGLALGDWQALGTQERESLRAQATLDLYRLGAHSVIDHPGELPACLQDLAIRRQKGEKP